MERFVTAFAARYFVAHNAWRDGQRTPAVWMSAFEAAQRWRPVVAQHLLLGMNAHINLDLAVVTAALAGGPEALPGSTSRLRRCQRRARHHGRSRAAGDRPRSSPWFGLVDKIGARSDEALINFSLRRARQQAWSLAERLVALPADQQAAEIDRVDRTVDGIAGRILRPGAALSTGMLVVRVREPWRATRALEVVTAGPARLAVAFGSWPGPRRSPSTSAGREVRITSPQQGVLRRSGATPSSTWSTTTWPWASRSWRWPRAGPALLQRFPDGASGKSFFQKRVPSGAPSWLQTTMVTTPNGTTSNALVLADMAHVAWAVNLGCLGFHVWPTHWDDMEHADELRIDLDPSPGVTFEMIREAAHASRACSWTSSASIAYPKTTGNRGVHVYVRLERHWDSYAVAGRGRGAGPRAGAPTARTSSPPPGGRRSGASGSSSTSTRTHPTRRCSARGSVRAAGRRPTVSAPFRWDELDAIHPDELTIATVPERLAERSAIRGWRCTTSPQSLEPLLDLSERDRAAGLLDAPWPPVYPKMPDEPPRVAPSRARRTEE